MVSRAASFGGYHSIETQLARIKLDDEHIAPHTPGQCPCFYIGWIAYC